MKIIIQLLVIGQTIILMVLVFKGLKDIGIEKAFRTIGSNKWRESGLTWCFSRRRGRKGKCRAAPGTYDRDNDPDSGCRIFSNTARFRKDRRPGGDPRTRTTRENWPACGKNQEETFNPCLKF